MKALAVALLLITSSCRTPTNLVVQDVTVGALSKFGSSTVVPFEATVSNDVLKGRLVAGTAKLRVFASLRLENPASFDPANPPAPQYDASGNPIDPALQPSLRFTPVNISQPPGAGTGDPVQVSPGDHKLVVDVVAVKGKALLPGKQVTFQAVGYVDHPWTNPAPEALYLDVRVARNSRGGDHDSSDNRKIVQVTFP